VNPTPRPEPSQSWIYPFVPRKSSQICACSPNDVIVIVFIDEKTFRPTVTSVKNTQNDCDYMHLYILHAVGCAYVMYVRP